jgi:polysaccharide biosynthesis transport protein
VPSVAAPMASESETRGLATARDYFRVLARRKWVVLLAVALLPLTAILVSARQDALYEAKAEVLLNPQNLAGSTLTGTTSGGIFQDPERIANTQADLASGPALAERVVAAAGVTDLDADELLASSSVSAKPNADLLEFTVENRDSDLAVRLANDYAEQFTLYRQEIDTTDIAAALIQVRERLDVLERRGRTTGQRYQALIQEEDRLVTAEALATSGTRVAREARDAEQIQPRTVRNAVLGIILGVGLGLILAFVLDSFDTRVRTAEEIGERLRLPLLGRIPRPPRWLRRGDELVMLAEPNSVEAESFRMLRTNLDFVSIDRNAQVLMITSGVEQEGKSTTAANLAVALARAGKRTVLVDVDLRHPFIRRFFRLDGRAGLTDVVIGRAQLDDVIEEVLIEPDPEDALSTVAMNGAQSEGSLEVIPSGPIPPNAGEFVGSRALAATLEQLRARADIVLLDAPPVLRVGDAMALTPVVDGVLVVVRFRAAHRSLLNELSRALDASPAPKLGFVLTDTDLGEGYGESYYHYHYQARAPRQRRRGRRRRRQVAVDSERAQ